MRGFVLFGDSKLQKDAEKDDILTFETGLGVKLKDVILASWDLGRSMYPKVPFRGFEDVWFHPKL